MAYDPTADTIRLQILDNIESTLRTILEPTYGTSLYNVQQYMGNDFEVTNYPAVVIVPGLQRNDDGRLALIEHALPVTLLLMVRAQDWREKIDRLVADVRVALLTDYTRGGVALTTRGTGEEVYDSEPSSPLGAAQVNVEVLFRTLYHDPGAAT